jgi:hypothetical protein
MDLSPNISPPKRHGKRASKSIRKNACPAYGKTYGHCGRPNHIETVCMQKTKPKPPLPQKAHNDQEGAIFDSLCSTSCGVSIDHHLYNQLNDCWIRQSSLKPQPSKVHSQHHATAHCARNHPPRPTQPPFPANNANRAHLKQWLLDYYAASTFNTCELQPLSLMHGPPMRLMVNPDVTPVAHHTLYQYHYKVSTAMWHWASLSQYQLANPSLGVIEWLSALKKNNQPRRTVDLQALNLHKKKTIFDCWNGYHSVAIHPDDRYLTL